MNHTLCTDIHNIQWQITFNRIPPEKHPVHILILPYNFSLVYFIRACGCQGKGTIKYSARKLFISEQSWRLSQYLGFCCMTQQLASLGNPTYCVFLVCDSFILREGISISLLPPSASDGNSTTSGSHHLYSPCAAVPLPLSTSQLFFYFLFFLLKRHLQAHAYRQAVVREIMISCTFTYGGSDSLNVNVSVSRRELITIWMHIVAQHRT